MGLRLHLFLSATPSQKNSKGTCSFDLWRPCGALDEKLYPFAIGNASDAVLMQNLDFGNLCPFLDYVALSHPAKDI